MPPIRILVVDDSVVIRKVLSEALAADPDIEVAGSAADGNIALAKIPVVHPDLVTLDVEMPGKSGIETLQEIRKRYPKLPVIMFSTLTERGATVTLEALSLGASDYVTKPSNTVASSKRARESRPSLFPKSRGFAARSHFRRPPRLPLPNPVSGPPASSSPSCICELTCWRSAPPQAGRTHWLRCSPNCHRTYPCPW